MTRRTVRGQWVRPPRVGPGLGSGLDSCAGKNPLSFFKSIIKIKKGFFTQSGNQDQPLTQWH